MSAWGDFHRELTALHEGAGAPSSRAIKAQMFGVTSHTTINDLLRGRKIPGLVITRKIVTTLGGDWEVFRPLWKAAMAEVQPIPGPPLVERVLDELAVIRNLLEQLVAEKRPDEKEGN